MLNSLLTGATGRGRKMGDVGRGMGRAGLLRLSKEGPTGCKPTPIMFLGNTVQSVRTFIQTHTCTRVTCTQAPRKDLHTLIQVGPMAAARSSPPRPNPQARSSPRPEAGPALPQLPHAAPLPCSSASLPLPLSWVRAGSRTHILRARNVSLALHFGSSSLFLVPLPTGHCR